MHFIFIYCADLNGTENFLGCNLCPTRIDLNHCEPDVHKKRKPQPETMLSEDFLTWYDNNKKHNLPTLFVDEKNHLILLPNVFS